MPQTITITYGEKVENHVGNQQIGDEVHEGISCKDLKKIEKKMKEKDYGCEYIDLKNLLDDQYKQKADEAGILVIRNFVDTFFNKEKEATKIFNDLKGLNWDRKALMRGKVVNKHARYNLCFADFSQEPDYDNGKGRVYDFKNVEYLSKIGEFLNKILKNKLNAEGNYYYDNDKCYIGFHGDTERKIVAGVRFGNDFPLYYQWYLNSESICKPYKINLGNGDLYIMSDKAVGYDWKFRSKITLRHAAGNLDVIV